MTTSPAWRPLRSPRLIDCVAQWIVKLDVTRIAVLTPATKTGNSYGGGRPDRGRVGVDDPDEEVRREERAEQHRLGRDEEEHAERVESIRELWFAGGGPWCSWSVRGLGVSAHCASSGQPRSRGELGDDVLDRHARVLAEPPDEVAPQPARPLAREGRDDHLVDPLVVDRLHRRGVRVRVRDLAVGLDALRAGASRAPRAAGAPPRDARPRRGSLCGQTSRNAAGPSAARVRMPVEQRSPSTVSFAITSTFA